MFELDKSSTLRCLNQSVNYLLEISHPAWGETYYLINNQTAIEYNGNTYQPFPFVMSLPTHGLSEGVNLTIANVDRQITDLYSQTIKNELPIKVKISVIIIEVHNGQYYSAIDEKGIFEVVGGECTKEALVLSLDMSTCMDYNIGVYRFNPNLFPNIYL